MDESENKRLGELIIELAKGNCMVLTEISLLMEKILYSIGNSRYNNKEDTEDAVQNLYLILYKKAGKFHANTNACAWVVRVYKNSITSHLRKRNREEAYLKEALRDRELGENTADEKFIENHLYLKEIFDRLSEYEQDLVIYSYWCNCTVREVAKIVHRPYTTVEYHLKKLEEKVKSIQTDEKSR